MRRDDVALRDIANTALLIAQFIQGLDKSAFDLDWETRSAVLYQLTVIGEATKRLSAAFRAQHAEVPWALMAGMRDRLIHGYDLTDWDEVWKSARDDVPRVLSRVQALLS
ncbi:MAG: DUF86 domain-containing protein [Chloroflexota bacterium]